jgi:protein N-terminal methyltransferase
VREAYARGMQQNGTDGWKGVSDRSTSVTFIQGTLQSFDPAAPLAGSTLVGRVGYAADLEPGSTTMADAGIDSGFDVIWCQWCLGHLSDADLVAFFRRCKSSLRDKKRSVIVVKENVCADARDGTARTEFDEEDSSLTRCASTFRFSL